MKKNSPSPSNDVDNTLQTLDSVGLETLNALVMTGTKTAAAKQLGIVRQTLYERIEKYNLNPILERIPEDALRTLKMSSSRAAETLVEGLEDRNKKYDIAGEILDRVGVVTPKGSPAVVQQFNTTFENLTDEQLDQLIQSKSGEVGTGEAS